MSNIMDDINDSRYKDAESFMSSIIFDIWSSIYSE